MEFIERLANGNFEESQRLALLSHVGDLVHEDNSFALATATKALPKINEIFFDSIEDTTGEVTTLSQQCSKTYIALVSHEDSLVRYGNWEDSMEPEKINIIRACKVMEKHRVPIFLSEILKNMPITTDGETLYMNETMSTVMASHIVAGIMSSALDILPNFIELVGTFVSSQPKFYDNSVKDVNSMDQESRRAYFKARELARGRSAHHAQLLIEHKVLNALTIHSCHSSPLIRTLVVVAISKLLEPLEVEKLKPILSPFVLTGSEHCPTLSHAISMESALLLSKPELGMWAVTQNGGSAHIEDALMDHDEEQDRILTDLVNNLSQSSEGNAIVAPLFEDGQCDRLLKSKNMGAKAAAASAFVKSMIRSKQTQGQKLLHVLETAADLLVEIQLSNKNNNNNNNSKSKDNNSTTNSLPSFSKVGTTPKHVPSLTEELARDGGEHITSMEKAVEIVAVLSTRTDIKEIMCSSNKKMSSCLVALSGIAQSVNIHSNAAFGIAYALFNLAVTNQELHKKQLSDKEISYEQYEQLKKIQEAQGVDEKTPEETDTPASCKSRILRMVAAGLTIGLVRLLNEGSMQTKEFAAKALCQFAVEEGVRGKLIAQGALSASCHASGDESLTKLCRLSAAHCVSKLLVTTNPNLLDDQLRLSCLAPLLLLCRDVDASNLMQFEALLSLANVLSCGDNEAKLFFHKKGLASVHYLALSEHVMVRRAAVEVCCNLASQEEFIKFLSHSDKLRLWLRYCEDTGTSVTDEEYLTSRAASGALAMCSDSEIIAQTLVKEGFGNCIASMLKSKQMELVHRSLVIALNVLSVIGKDAAVELMQHEFLALVQTLPRDMMRDLHDLLNEIGQTLVALTQ